MIQERVEEYLGAIYRLRVDKVSPVPLSQLTGYFDFSPVSVHEMIKKLSKQDWVCYHPYHGVTLTEQGEHIAEALLRRHRLWERFLTDVLEVPWEDAHEIAGRLEHATPEMVTERLADFLGSPDSCPHGGPIPPKRNPIEDQCLPSLPVSAKARITRISPESAKLLHQLQQAGISPGCQFKIIDQHKTATVIQIGERKIDIPIQNAQAIWAESY